MYIENDHIVWGYDPYVYMGMIYIYMILIHYAHMRIWYINIHYAHMCKWDRECDKCTIWSMHIGMYHIHYTTYIQLLYTLYDTYTYMLLFHTLYNIYPLLIIHFLLFPSITSIPYSSYSPIFPILTHVAPCSFCRTEILDDVV